MWLGDINYWKCYLMLKKFNCVNIVCEWIVIFK